MTAANPYRGRHAAPDDDDVAVAAQGAFPKVAAAVLPDETPAPTPANGVNRQAHAGLPARPASPTNGADADPAPAQPRVFEARRVDPKSVARPNLPPRLAALLADPAESVRSEPHAVARPSLPPRLATLLASDVGPAAVGPAAVEPAAVEPAAVGPAAVGPAAVEPATVEPAAVEPAAVEPAAVEPAAVEPAADEPAPQRAHVPPEPYAVTRSEQPRSVPWSAANDEAREAPAVVTAGGRADEPTRAWLAHTPPAPQQPTVWETPAGFVPIRPPRGKSSTLNYVAVGVVVAAVAALGWFGYQAFFKADPKAAVVAVPVATVAYTSPDGHFTVGLPAQPVTSTYAQSYGAFHLQASMAAVPGVHEVAAGLVVTPSIPAEHMGEFMQGAVNGFARNSHLSNVESSTYEGHPAITATGTAADGTTLQLLFYAYSSTRMYMLMAPDATAMTALEKQFRPTA